MRTITIGDAVESMGHYFWDVISVGFVLWIPTMLLDTSLRANPDSQFLVTACLLLVFILLNPAPEVIYLTRHDSPLDVLKRSYDFVLDNWIEWFLPMALVLAPLGLSLFFKLSSQLGRGAGIGFHSTGVCAVYRAQCLADRFRDFCGTDRHDSAAADPTAHGWHADLSRPPVRRPIRNLSATTFVPIAVPRLRPIGRTSRPSSIPVCVCCTIWRTC
jgi:hypothetical protein